MSTMMPASKKKKKKKATAPNPKVSSKIQKEVVKWVSISCELSLTPDWRMRNDYLCLNSTATSLIMA
jgi:hypothetical protein